MLAKIFSFFCGFLLLTKAVQHGKYVSYVYNLNSDSDNEILASWGVPGYSESYPYNVLIFGFYSPASGATGALSPWFNPLGYFSNATLKNLTGTEIPTNDAFRKALKRKYKANGIKLLISVFGSNSDVSSLNYSATELGKTLANIVKEYEFDGIDIDWEESETLEKNTCEGEEWLINLTSTLRDNLSNQGYYITHAPQAPYFGGDLSIYPCGGYLTVHESIKNLINWYNIQFYNQGETTYDTFYNLFVQSNGWASNTSVYQLILGSNSLHVSIPSTMIVIGKPVSSLDIDNDNTGFINSSTFYSILYQAIDNHHDSSISVLSLISNDSESYLQWSAGFMTWQFSSDQADNFSFSKIVVQAFNENNVVTTNSPSQIPSLRTPHPTRTPTIRVPTNVPVPRPTRTPITRVPTNMPVPRPTRTPITREPTNMPVPRPTRTPITRVPTGVPVPRPTRTPITRVPTGVPVPRPTRTPITRVPTNVPVPRPTRMPITREPTNMPVSHPTRTSITREPTNMPVPRPTRMPITREPTNMPVPHPTRMPITREPTNMPVSRPTRTSITREPTNMPVPRPTRMPITREPTNMPVPRPTRMPITREPTNMPVSHPTRTPTTSHPTHTPTTEPPTTLHPTRIPTTERPTKNPTMRSTFAPTTSSSRPTRRPSLM